MFPLPWKPPRPWIASNMLPLVSVRGVTDPTVTLPTTILGHNFSAPFYITSCGRAQFTHPDGELGLLRGANRSGLLYLNAASTNQEALDANRGAGQVTFQQLLLDNNMTKTQEDFDRARATGASAIALTVDSAMGTNRHRSWRFGVNGRGGGPADFFSWETYATYTNMTDLPVILKGVQTVEDVREAVAHGVPAVILSNVRLMYLFCLHFLYSFTSISKFRF